MDTIAQSLSGTEAGQIYQNLPAHLQSIFLVVIVAMLVVTLFAFLVSGYLALRYVKYNRRQDSCDLNGEQVARRVLDSAGLSDIEVSKSGSLLFGNSYSHYFKKVRLRRRTIEKTSVASLGMGAQKASLAVLDREGDPDMKVRNKFAVIGMMGPIAFIPLLVVGAVLDIIINNGQGNVTLLACGIGIIFYVLAFVFQFRTLKTEKKAQDRACQILAANGMATDEEIRMLRKLFRLYNIEYINNMVLSMLEILYRALQIMAAVNGSGSKSSD
ncbi:zinc metallopeptidase [Paratractidigestivibacter sp.]|uniref:zinc metallopeptidase n=1 Tax=Paratractidigestivibacter sp. TaxID=2847316 RepID=UPI002ABD494F|nr:zinc metallopeptidase [Paratractidigestivibacter sp.]